MDQRLLAASHGFSQRATSFIASWYQGIHRMPFSCSRSPRAIRRASTMHRNHPQLLLGPNPRAKGFPHDGIALAQHTTVHASEHQPHRWTLSVRSDIRWKCAETHQNLIHRDKDHPGHNRRSGRLLSETPPASQFQRTKMPIAVASPRYACSELDPESRSPHSPNMVEVIGLEPTTPCLQSRCSPS
jgi:hypothetical protein